MCDRIAHLQSRQEDDYALDTDGNSRYSFVMIRLPILKDELAFLEKHLPELEERPDLGQLASEFKKRIVVLRQQIKALQGEK